MNWKSEAKIKILKSRELNKLGIECFSIRLIKPRRDTMFGMTTFLHDEKIVFASLKQAEKLLRSNTYRGHRPEFLEGYVKIKKKVKTK